MTSRKTWKRKSGGYRHHHNLELEAKPKTKTTLLCSPPPEYLRVLRPVTVATDAHTPHPTIPPPIATKTATTTATADAPRGTAPLSWNVDPLGSVPPVTVGFGVKSTALGLDTVSVDDAPLAWNELNTDPDERGTCEPARLSVSISMPTGGGYGEGEGEKVRKERTEPETMGRADPEEAGTPEMGAGAPETDAPVAVVVAAALETGSSGGTT